VVAPPSPFSGSCGLYLTSDASVEEAVGCSGIGLLGAWRWMVVIAFVVEEIILGSINVHGQRPRPAWVLA
jgi:hypothetical protein